MAIEFDRGAGAAVLFRVINVEESPYPGCRPECWGWAVVPRQAVVIPIVLSNSRYEHEDLS
ncbi:MAG: hypothetical protein ACPG5T_08815, partial [Endozoicomonas sp.]